MTPRLRFLWTDVRANGDRVDYFRHITGPCVAVIGDAIAVDGAPVPAVPEALKNDVAAALEELEELADLALIQVVREVPRG